MCIKEIQCPHCGNQDVKRIQLCVVLPSSLYRNLYQDEQGLIWAEEEIETVDDGIDPVSEYLYCKQCERDFSDPGIQIT